MIGSQPPLSLRDIPPKGGDAETKALSNPVSPPLKGEGDRGRRFHAARRDSAFLRKFPYRFPFHYPGRSYAGHSTVVESASA